MGAAPSKSIASFAESVAQFGDDIIDEARVAIGSVLAGGFSLIQTIYGSANGPLINAVLRFFAEEIEDSYLTKLAHKHGERSTETGDIVDGMASDLVELLTGPTFTPVPTIIIPALVKKATPEDMKDVLSVLKTVMDAANLDNIIRFIRDLDGQKVLDWVLDIIKDSRSALRDAINQASEKGMGSLQFIVDAEVNDIAGATVALGVSIDINYLLYFKTNGGDMTGWTGIRALSFHAGVTVTGGIAAGGDVSLGVGFHTSKPDGVDGFSFAGDVEGAYGFEMKGGIGLSMTYPPVPNQFVVAAGVGEKVEISVGIIATSIFSYFDPENGVTLATPSAENARLSGNPNLFYSKYDWDKLEFDLEKMNFGAMIADGDFKFPSYYWKKLGWNEESWNNLTDVPTTETATWDRLSDEHKLAARKLGFDAKTWNAPVCVDAWAYSTPDAYWDVFNWNEMLEHEMRLWSGLGWDERSWQGNSSPPDTMSASWEDLSYEEQCYAIELGYDKTRWEGWDKQMVAKTGDAFNYSPWGGKCLVKYTLEGCLWVYRESNTNNSGTRVWKCMSASDTQKLLAGYTVQVLWGNTVMYRMRVTNENTFVVHHGDGRDYNFERM
jgi:hypothetical protein